MADVPGSGNPLSLLGIHNEVAEGNYSSGTSRTNVSLKEVSDGTVATLTGGNKSAPHAMSEFYGYTHGGVGAPSSLSYTAASTTTTTFTFTEASSTTKVYVYLWDLNGDDANEGQVIYVDDPGDGSSTHITVDGSGTTSKTLGNGNDYYNDDTGDSPSTETLTLATNDYVDIKFRSRNSSDVYSSYTSALRCWTLPTAPGAPTLGSETINSIAVSWSAPTGGASSYILYLDTNTSPTSQAAAQSGTSVTISSLSSNTRYYARLKSVGGGGDNSAYGATSNTYTLPDQVSNLSSPSKTSTTVNLDWDAVSGGTQSYKVEYKNALLLGASWIVFATGVTASEDQVTGLTGGIQYNFRVSAANGDGVYGATSSVINVLTNIGGGGGKP